MIAIKLTKETKQYTYHNPLTKESVNVNCNYLGYTAGNLFIGIKSITSLNGDKVKKDNLPMSSGVVFISDLCYLFPLISVISLFSGVVLLVGYISNNPFLAISLFFIGILINMVIFLIANYIEQLFLHVIPKRNGWLRAYIDDYGTVSVVDEKNGKTIPVTTVIDGKKKIELVTQKEFDQVNDAFFGKNGLFNKKK